jgi:predicted deacetylase
VRSSHFLLCIHDATPAYARETRLMIRDLAPLVGRRFSFAVVPNWHGRSPLESHRDYCRLVQDASEELLLHGYFHRRQRGWGAFSLLVERCDELNGLDLEETRRIIERGQHVFIDVFGEPARGFLAPGWQPAHLRQSSLDPLGLEYVFGFFGLHTRAGRSVPLATWTWDVSRWGWTGHIGHGIGQWLQSRDRVPTLAIHPRDLQRGFWPKILRLTEKLLETGYEATTSSALLEMSDVEVGV